MNKYHIVIFIILLLLFSFIILIYKNDHFDVIPPPTKINSKNIAVLFPYREQVQQNRSQQLKDTVDYYSKLNMPNIDFFVIEQTDGKKFNRGKLLNVGHDIIKKSDKKYNNEIHHDIDVVADYTLIQYFNSDNVIACKKAWYNDFIGLMVVVPLKIMDKINGFPNNFWGWGGEDDVFGARLKNKNIKAYYADPNITKITGAKHTDSRELDLDNKTRNQDIQNDIDSNFKSGLADLEYTIVKTEKINDRTTKITVNID